jgi:hypothetical protein
VEVLERKLRITESGGKENSQGLPSRLWSISSSLLLLFQRLS